MEVEAAFNQLLNSNEVTKGFRICLFIDGLDEFDDKGDESLWSFANTLVGWTASGHIKLCVSSREEASILNALKPALRAVLHTVTRSDITRLIRSKLASNPNFQRLARDDAHQLQCKIIQAKIADRAEGVFLWVVLVLKTLEEELAAQTSMKALINIVEEVPPGLDDFFARILDSIPRHHARGAYFVFAMILRLHGHCMGREPVGDMSAVDSDERMGLALYGLSCVFDAFESHGPREQSKKFTFPFSRCANMTEYVDRLEKIFLRLQSWCRGLVEGGRGLPPEAVFSHRSIADFLAGELPKIAEQWHLDDAWVAEGLLSICLAEEGAQDIIYDFSQGRNYFNNQLSAAMDCLARTTSGLSASSATRLFTLVDQIDAQKSKRCTLSQTGITIFDKAIMSIRDGNIEYATFTPAFVISTASAVPWTDYVVSKLADPATLRKPVDQLQMLGALVSGTFARHNCCIFPDVSPIVEVVLRTGISPNTKYPPFREFTFDKWHNAMQTEQYRERKETKQIKTPWREVLSVFLSFFAFSNRGSVPVSIWNELLVWLRYGADVPVDVLVIKVSFWKSAVGFRFPEETAGVAVRFLTAHSLFRFANHIKYFQTFRSTTVSSMIRWHNPPNRDDLLRYTDPLAALAENPQEWRPPPFSTFEAEGRVDFTADMRVDFKDFHFLDMPPGPISKQDCWRYNLLWKSDCQSWVVNDAIEDQHESSNI